MEKEKILQSLNFFLEKDKFSEKQWNNRGLNPPSDFLCDKLSVLINDCCINLIKDVENDKGKKQRKKHY